MDPLSALLASTNWIFVLVATVVSMGIGMLWFGNALFGKTYGRRMKLPPMESATKENCPPMNMGSTLTWEFISRALYFIGIGRAFSVAPQETLRYRICLAIILWLAFALSTQISAVVRSLADRRVLRIVGGKMLLDTIIAVLLWTMVF